MSQDIRDWAADKGIELAAKGRIPNKVREEYEAEMDAHEGDPQEPLLIVPDGPEPPPEPVDPVPDPAAPVAETAPRKPPRQRKSLLERKSPDGKPLKPPPRVSIATIGSFAYSGVGYIFSRNPRGIPVARSMDIMAPVAGEVLDDVVKHTIIDRVLQPIARSGERGEKVAALVGYPMLVGICVNRPEWFPALRPAMRMALMLSIEISEPAMRKAQAKAEKFQERFGSIDVDAMIDATFADIDLPTAHSPDEDAAVRRAKNSQE